MLHIVLTVKLLPRHIETSPCLDFHLGIDLPRTGIRLQTRWRLRHIVIDVRLFKTLQIKAVLISYARVA